jgi:septum formation protein
MNGIYKNVVLASQSPRRQELIKLIFDDFQVLPAECDETLPEGIGAREAVEYLSKIKNEASAYLSPENSLIISADTIVSINNEILGKPVDKDDARRMITLLSGNIHQVYTGVTLSFNEKKVTFSEKTDVEFYSLTQEEIEDYICTSEPYDKAGSYGIQGKAGLLVKGINGDYYNVVGLPVARLKREILEFEKEL